ncbi:MAG TPA: hypothetical protein VFM05_06570, partial [Candidatus Saccharimonadales bacterium]|nr:hypothetical protein [Candidatus Saccharimonadales bacterium]
RFGGRNPGVTFKAGLYKGTYIQGREPIEVFALPYELREYPKSEFLALKAELLPDGNFSLMSPSCDLVKDRLEKGCA